MILQENQRVNIVVRGLDEIIPNPDHPDLVIRYLKVDQEMLSHFFPRFLRRFLAVDLAQEFMANPRYIYATPNEMGEVEIQELTRWFQTDR